MLGREYEKKVLFSTQHLWIFSARSLEELAAKAGFSRIEVRYFQRYGLENLLGWCLERRPNTAIELPEIQSEMDALWRGVCGTHRTADYVVLYAWK